MPMTLSMYQASIPAFQKHLQALDGILDKAEAYVLEKRLDPDALLKARLFPDMFTLTRQVQLACDFAKGTAARLAGVVEPSHPDTETSFPDLKSRISTVQAFLATFSERDMAGAETRSVTLKVGPQEMTFTGADYLLHFALPNFYFHCSMTYALLRHNGLELGKRDFMRRGGA